MNEDEKKRQADIKAGTVCAGPCLCEDDDCFVTLQLGNPEHKHIRAFCCHHCLAQYVFAMGEIYSLNDQAGIGDMSVTEILFLVDQAIAGVRRQLASPFN